MTPLVRNPASRRPKVSVIVPAYGLAHYLPAALASLQAQTYGNWEAIVIDDGAPDDVAGAFAPFAVDGRFRLLQTDNRGLSTARNRAIAESTAPFVSLLDADDSYQPGYLACMLGAIEEDPLLGFVTSDALLVGPNERGDRRYFASSASTGPVTLERVLSRKVMINVACTIRRAALDEVGGFDQTLRAVEDLDLWIRLLAAGWNGAVEPQALVVQTRRPDSMSRQQRNMLVASCSVYRKAISALQGRPEGVVADTVLRTLEEQLRWLNGEDQILRGDIAAGLRLLAGAERRSVRWRVALALVRRAPLLAKLALRVRKWLPEPRRGRRRHSVQGAKSSP
jgi:cellulose synthase/poly-beta-1,6-N-acetylglucosamine synthase-like glycosyltransferase